LTGAGAEILYSPIAAVDVISINIQTMANIGLNRLIYRPYIHLYSPIGSSNNTTNQKVTYKIYNYRKYTTIEIYNMGLY